MVVVLGYIATIVASFAGRLGRGLERQTRDPWNLAPVAQSRD
jgi:hypothetical protein